jgi:hypothetical protein
VLTETAIHKLLDREHATLLAAADEVTLDASAAEAAIRAQLLAEILQVSYTVPARSRDRRA